MSSSILFSILRHPDRFLVLLAYKLKIFNKPRELTQQTFFGKNITIVLPEIVSSLLYLTGRYETDVEDVFAKYIKKGDIIVDIGAHFGYFSLLAAFLTGRKGKVYAFEPTPSTYSILLKNARRFATITPVNKAVYNKHDQLTLHDYGLQFGALNGFFEPRINKKITYKPYKVTTVSLDNYFVNKAKPNFIKIDAESSEYYILKGMQKILTNHRPILCIESGDMNIMGVKKSREIIDFLRKKKYQAYQYVNGALKEYHPDRQKGAHINLLFLPNRTTND